MSLQPRSESTSVDERRRDCCLHEDGSWGKTPWTKSTLITGSGENHSFTTMFGTNFLLLQISRRNIHLSTVFRHFSPSLEFVFLLPACFCNVLRARILWAGKSKEFLVFSKLCSVCTNYPLWNESLEFGTHLSFGAPPSTAFFSSPVAEIVREIGQEDPKALKSLQWVRSSEWELGHAWRESL